LEAVINKHGMENGSDTPDFILAEYLMNALNNFDNIVNRRELWYGRKSEAVDSQLDIPFPSKEDELMNTVYDDICREEAEMEELRMEGYLLREDDYPEPKKKTKKK